MDCGIPSIASCAPRARKPTAANRIVNPPADAPSQAMILSGARRVQILVVRVPAESVADAGVEPRSPFPVSDQSQYQLLRTRDGSRGVAGGVDFSCSFKLDIVLTANCQSG